MAGAPSVVAGILMNRFSRSTSFHSSLAEASVASVSMRQVGGDLDGDAPVDAVGGVVDRLEDVAGVAYVGGGEREDRLVDVGALGGELAHLLVVPLALGQRGGEDRRVGGDPDDVVLVDEVGEVAGLDALA